MLTLSNADMCNLDLEQKNPLKLLVNGPAAWTRTIHFFSINGSSPPFYVSISAMLLMYENVSHVILLLLQEPTQVISFWSLTKTRP